MSAKRLAKQSIKPVWLLSLKKQGMMDSQSKKSSQCYQKVMTSPPFTFSSGTLQD